MVDYLNASLSDIIADAKANDRVDELKAYGLGTVAAKKVVNDEEVKYRRKRTFLEIKRHYFGLYYPEMLPKAKPKKQTMYDLLEEL